MVAQTQARSLTITINGNDWSANLVSFEIGFESYQQGTGLILKKGTLVLCNIAGDSRAIDPIDQNDFAPGNTVTVKLPGNVAHPLGNSLRILAPPEVSPINSGIPDIEGNLIVSIPVGCNLAFYQSDSSDDEKTGVTLGTSIAINTVIQNLLVAGGVSSSAIDLSLSSDVEVGFPFSKNGGSFVNLAGEFAYPSYHSETATNPRILYCNQLNAIKNLNIVSPKEKIFSGNIITLGTNDRLYRRQLDLSIAPGKVEIDGVKRKVKDLTEDYPYIDTVESEDETIVTTYYKGNTPVDIEGIDVLFSGGDFPAIPVVVSPGTGATTLGDVTISVATGDRTSEEHIGSFVDSDGYIVYEIQIRYVEAELLYPGEWRNTRVSSDADTNKNRLAISEAIVVQYTLEKGAIIKKVTSNYQNLFKAQPSADFADDFSTAFPITAARLRNIVLARKSTETWTKVKGRKDSKYVYTISEQSPRIVNNPTYISDEDFSSAVAERADRWQQETRGTIANKRDTTLSQAQQWTGIYEVQEFQLKGDQLFGNGANAKNLKLQSPFWFNRVEPLEDSPQPDIFARIEGEIVNGRQYQYLIECEPSLLASVTAPLAGVTVVEPTQKRYFLADALTWYHTATETYVAFAGIFAGSSVLAGTAPTIFGNAIVAAPVPTAAIDIAGVAFIDTITGSAER